jgi:hypothetical protein
MITEEKYTELMQQGYTAEEIDQAIREKEMEQSYSDMQNPSTARKSVNLIPSPFPNNSMEWQLEVETILSGVEHLLRGDISVEKAGSIIFETPLNEEDRPLNEKGVKEIMRIMKGYVNINKLLADYDDTQINECVYEFGTELAKLFEIKYDKWGISTEEKRGSVKMIVLTLVDIVLATYLRARHGKERDTLRKIYSINENIGNNGMGYDMGSQKQERSILNPMRYIPVIGGKYK